MLLIESRGVNLIVDHINNVINTIDLIVDLIQLTNLGDQSTYEVISITPHQIGLPLCRTAYFLLVCDD